MATIALLSAAQMPKTNDVRTMTMRAGWRGHIHSIPATHSEPLPKLHLVVHHSGFILDALLTPANVSDKDEEVRATLLFSAAGGAVLCDLGYRDKDLRARLEAEYGLIWKPSTA